MRTPSSEAKRRGRDRSSPASRPPRAQRLGLWYRTVLACMRRAYFGPVQVGGARPARRRRPRLVLASHRNGALDGVLVQSAFPHAQYLVSMQLLRGPLRFLFTGIPVVRQRDVERYGMDRSQLSDPVSASVEHLMAGGDLVIFPEGTSEWRPSPGEYQRGAARIWCRLREAGTVVDVVPLGLMYSAPERFCSIAELWCGPVLDLPDHGDEPRHEWERHVHAAMTRALDAVSANCPDPGTFDLVQRRATERARAGESFAAAFLDEQAAARGSHGGQEEPGEDGVEAAVPPAATFTPEARSAPGTPAPSPWPRRIGLAFMWLLAPVLLVAWRVGLAADARNTVSFFRVLGGTPAMIVWVVVLAVAGVWAGFAGAGAVAAIALGAGLLCVATGRMILLARRWQPDSAPLAEEASR